MTLIMSEENRRRIWRVKVTDGKDEKTFNIIAKNMHAAYSKTIRYMMAKKIEKLEVLEIVNVLKIDF